MGTLKGRFLVARNQIIGETRRVSLFRLLLFALEKKIRCIALHMGIFFGSRTFN